MAVRITEKPLRIGFAVTESAANTFTTAAINLPTTPSIAVSRSGSAKAIGVEIMKVFSECRPPDLEAAQDNTVTVQIVKGPAPTAMVGVRDNRTIWQRIRESRVTEITAVGEIHETGERSKFDNLTDHDGNGEIVADNEIHASILGVGNAGAKSCGGYMLYHLVELDQTEALFELIETAQ